MGGEILQAVRDMTQDYETRQSRCRDVVKHLKALAAKIPDTIARENLKPILDEIAAEIGLNTLDRMAAFLQSADDQQTDDTENLSLAISGWLLGADAATAKLPTAISAYKVRGLIREYLAAATAPERERTYGYIKQEPGGDPAIVAELLAHMKPPVAAPEPVADKPGYYEIAITALPKEPPVDVLRPTPARVRSLSPLSDDRHARAASARPSSRSTGGRASGARAACAPARPPATATSSSRPAGCEEHQKQYGYSAREHAAVLNSLRDACRRFSIDTDRVYLSGQSIGGDAAWDIGLAHPDLWAGVIPIVAQSDRYCTAIGKTPATCRSTWWRANWTAPSSSRTPAISIATSAAASTTTVVEYLGRGHEDFYDEILRIFDWMGRFHRNFFPREFACETMRSWDNFFWWVEVQGLPPRSLVDPADWPPPAGTQPSQVKAKITDEQRPDHPHRHHAGDGLALAQNARFQPAGDDHGQRPAHQRGRPEDPRRSEDPLGRRSHPRRPPASVLGEDRGRHGPGSRGVGQTFRLPSVRHIPRQQCRPR